MFMRRVLRSDYFSVNSGRNVSPHFEKRICLNSEIMKTGNVKAYPFHCHEIVVFHENMIKI